MTTLLRLVLKVWKQSALIPSWLFVGTSLKTMLTAVAAGQSASGSSSIESFKDMRILGLGMSAIDKQVTPCHKKSVLMLMMDGWPGQGSWGMEFECQALQSWTELARVAKIVPHAHACEVGAVTDVSRGTCWKRTILTRCELFTQLEVYLTSVWKFFSTWIPVPTIDFLDWILTCCL